LFTPQTNSNKTANSHLALTCIAHCEAAHMKQKQDYYTVEAIQLEIYSTRSL